MKRSEKLHRMFMAVVLALMVSGCATIGNGGQVPEPTLDYKWSEAFEAVMPDGELKLVKCLTVDDKRRIDAYIEFIKANNALSGRR